ncbi:hypothetical protein [Halorussus salinus]|uniref:hypothetical protein n=1 Tax=Halorussus salinus TaxID=1364935 RepID=UPI00138EF015|nr:hypothetical protein [Halorussus salinus]
MAAFAERLEGSEPEITELQSRNEETGGIEADVSVEIPLHADVDGGITELSVTNAGLTDDGDISIQFSTAIDRADEEASAIDALPSEVGDASPTDMGREAETTPEGATDANATASGVTDGGTAIVSTPSSAGATAADRPAYKDPEELEAVYDAERTFPEMRDELGVDVTPKTVRHYMVEYGIHDPETVPSDDDGPKPAYKDPEELAAVYDAGRTFPEMRDELGVDVTPKTVRHYMVEYGIHDPEADPSESELVAGGSDRDALPADDAPSSDRDVTPDSGDVAADIADEVNLPGDLSVVGVTEAVCTAKTLYEVQRELGIDREQTHRLLSELNLLELVHGRVSTVSVQSRTRETVERRIREAVTERRD